MYACIHVHAGKLMYMLMDSSDANVQELLEFKCVRPLLTVYNFLDERGGIKLLSDPLLNTATAEIVTGKAGKLGGPSQQLMLCACVLANSSFKFLLVIKIYDAVTCRPSGKEVD